MLVNRCLGWWRGTEAGDLDEYLRTRDTDGGPVARVVHATCRICGGGEFRVLVDGAEGYAERVCVICRHRFVMLDSADYAADAEPGAAMCPCGRDAFNVAVGFSFRADGDVRWVSLGLRCVHDDVLGLYADWNIDYSPTGQLLSQV